MKPLLIKAAPRASFSRLCASQSSEEFHHFKCSYQKGRYYRHPYHCSKPLYHEEEGRHLDMTIFLFELVIKRAISNTLPVSPYHETEKPHEDKLQMHRLLYMKRYTTHINATLPGFLPTKPRTSKQELEVCTHFRFLEGPRGNQL